MPESGHETELLDDSVGNMTIRDLLSGRLGTEQMTDVLDDVAAPIGKLLVDNQSMDWAISGAIEENLSQRKADSIGAQVMNGLIIAGLVESAYVRYPRIHKMLGRTVFGNRRYYQLKEPLLGR
jgi:hypothetical protein